ncbi:hypothetical protein C7S10_21870 [Nocardioides currus]|uniref:Uncharacterized protein n=1 Tax=Nocardioides currus TaxID=2133958 RepID=A0A2R7YR83_9ACTN|nr:hypothetical protein C7S10_21870 [Nocardioides currus]
MAPLVVNAETMEVGADYEGSPEEDRQRFCDHWSWYSDGHRHAAARRFPYGRYAASVAPDSALRRIRPVVHRNVEYAHIASCLRMKPRQASPLCGEVGSGGPWTEETSYGNALWIKATAS